jgi:hypothetical protein
MGSAPATHWTIPEKKLKKELENKKTPNPRKQKNKSIRQMKKEGE